MAEAVSPETVKLIQTVVDEVFAAALAFTALRPIAHGAVRGAQSLVDAILDSLLPRIAANLAAKGVKVG